MGVAGAAARAAYTSIVQLFFPSDIAMFSSKISTLCTVAVLVLALLQSSFADDSFYDLTVLDHAGEVASLKQYSGKVSKNTYHKCAVTFLNAGISSSERS